LQESPAAAFNLASSQRQPGQLISVLNYLQSDGRICLCEREPFICLKDYPATVRKRVISLVLGKKLGVNQAQCFGVKAT
jgi:hypothetical protein